MPRAAKTSAACARKWCRMPAPAPCASTYSSRASCGRTSIPSSVFAKALVEACEDAHELGLYVEDFDDRIVAELLHALQCVDNREVAVVQLAIDLIPFDRHRDGSTGRWAHTVGRDHQLAGAVLEGDDVDPAFPLADRALCRPDGRMLIGDEARKQDRELQALRIRQLAAERQHD